MTDPKRPAVTVCHVETFEEMVTAVLNGFTVADPEPLARIPGVIVVDDPAPCNPADRRPVQEWWGQVLRDAVRRGDVVILASRTHPDDKYVIPAPVDACEPLVLPFGQPGDLDPLFKAAGDAAHKELVRDLLGNGFHKLPAHRPDDLCGPSPLAELVKKHEADAAVDAAYVALLRTAAGRVADDDVRPDHVAGPG